MKKTCFLSNVFNFIAKFSSQFAYIYHFLKILQPMRLFGPVRLFGTLKYSKPLTYIVISSMTLELTLVLPASRPSIHRAPLRPHMISSYDETSFFLLQPFRLWHARVGT